MKRSKYTYIQVEKFLGGGKVLAEGADRPLRLAPSMKRSKYTYIEGGKFLGEGKVLGGARSGGMREKTSFP